MSDVSEALGRKCVGPAPWYWETFPSLGEPYEWRFVPQGQSSYPNGNPVLFRRETTAASHEVTYPVLVARIYTRVLRPNESHVLLWGPRRRDGDMLIETFAINDLGAIADAATVEREPLWTAGAAATNHITIPQRLPAGRASDRYVADVGSAFEVLLLAEGPAHREAATSIYVWQPATGAIDVIPLTWFREDTNDLGYEWITRVMRDPSTGHIFGDGIRVAPFELDAQGARLPTSPHRRL
jgi:hypothetical protein